MDSLTQIVLGAAVGEAVLGKKVGNKAMLYGAIAGTIPDLDVFSNHFVDTVTALEIHRGFTHSIVFSVLFAPVFGWLISKIERKTMATWRDWSLLMFWALFTHPLLDAQTTWGTQLFWPLDVRLEFKNIFVIDPLYTLPLLILLIMAMRLPKSAIKRRKYNRLGLVISTSYLLLTIILKGISYTKFQAALEEQEINYNQIQNKPAPLNSILWTANVEVDEAFLIGDYSFFDSQPINFNHYPKDHHLLGSLINEYKIERLIKISKGWFIITEKDGELYFNDLRFGVLDLNAEDPQFVFSYRILQEDGEIIIEEVERKPAEARELISGLGNRILGN